MNGFSLAVVLTASIPVIISASPFVIIHLNKYGETYMKLSLKLFGLFLIVMFCSFSYYKKKFDFEMHKRRVRRKNNDKVSYNKRIVNTGFKGGCI